LIDGHFLPSRSDLAGAFGDLGTFAPLTIGMISACHLDPTNVMIVFGLCYFLSALVYRMSMPVQPMKAIAALAIVQGATIATIAGSSLTIGVLMLIFALTGSLGWFAKITPRAVVRGIQLGLAFTLIVTAIGFMQKSGAVSILGVNVSYLTVGAICFAIVLVLSNNRKIPSLLVVVPIGLGLATVGTPFLKLVPLQPSLPTLSSSLTYGGIITGLVTLTIPQIPLTIGNSVIATESLSRLLCPGKRTVTVKRLGLTLGVMNVFSSAVGGVPMCHGAGGLAAHYRFGARTSKATIIMGIILVSFGLLYGKTLTTILGQFPLPILGVILLFGALQLALTIRDVTGREEIFIVILVSVLCAFIPYGFVIGWPTGILLTRVLNRKGRVSMSS